MLKKILISVIVIVVVAAVRDVVLREPLSQEVSRSDSGGR